MLILGVLFFPLYFNLAKLFFFYYMQHFISVSLAIDSNLFTLVNMNSKSPMGKDKCPATQESLKRAPSIHSINIY